jgi:GT2 family glycosyltransferase
MVKTLSIVIVTWNAKNYAAECLDSLRTLMPKPEIEVLVVDNNSSDGTPELIREKYPEVVLIQNRENLGFARANNIGIRESAGEYVGLINSDVRVLNGCLEQMQAYMNANREIGVLGPRMLDAKGHASRSYMRSPTLWRYFCRALALDDLFPRSKLFGSYTMNYFDREQTAEVDVLNGWFWLIRREALNQVGPLDETFFMYGEDIDWCKRFRDRGWKVVYYPKTESIHYGGASSSKAPVRFYIEMQRANLQYWRKHFNPFSQALYFAIVFGHQILRLLGYGLLSASKSRRADASFKAKRSISCMLWMVGLPYQKKEETP